MVSHAAATPEADPVASMDMSRAEDPDKNALLAMLQAWVEVFGTGQGKGVTLQEVIEHCDRFNPGMNGYAHPVLRAAVMAGMPPQHRKILNAEVLGYWLRGKKDRRVGDMWFRKGIRSNSEPARWWVEVAEKPQCLQ